MFTTLGPTSQKFRILNQDCRKLRLNSLSSIGIEFLFALCEDGNARIGVFVVEK